AAVDPDDFLDLAAVGGLFFHDLPHGTDFVGNLFGKLVALAEDVTNGGDNVLGVAIVLGEDQSFRNFLAAREDFSKQLIAKGLEDGANLVFGDYAAVEFFGVILDILIGFLPADAAGLLVTEIYKMSGWNL